MRVFPVKHHKYLGTNIVIPIIAQSGYHDLCLVMLSYMFHQDSKKEKSLETISE